VLQRPERFLKSVGQKPTALYEQLPQTLSVLMYWLVFGFNADFSFMAIHGLKAVCLMVKLDDTYWAELT